MSQLDLQARTLVTAGASGRAIYEAARSLLEEVGAGGDVVVDVGCGAAAFRAYVTPSFRRYLGADATRYPDAPEDLELVRVDLDRGTVDLGNEMADAVTCLETIEHVENPRALARELFRLAKPGAWILVTTPNQLSVLSKLGLVLKNEFVHFQERPGLYPAHISALLEVDLIRIFRELGLQDVQVRYTGSGRIPFSGKSWPAFLSSQRGARARAFSDNVLIVGRKAA